jgi:hypothetical protein
MIRKCQATIVKPGDGGTGRSEVGFAKDGVVAAAIEVDGDLFRGHFDVAGSFDELSVEVFGLGLGEAFELAGEPTVAAMGNDGEDDVEVDVETHLARQAIQVEEVDADAQAVLNAVAARIARHKVAGGNVGVVAHEQGEPFAAQAGDGDLSERAAVTVESKGFVDIANTFIEPFGNIDLSLMPSVFGQGLEPAGDGCATSANGDEGDAALVEAGEVLVVGEFGIETEPLGIAAGGVPPEIDEAEDFAGLVGAGEVGVGVA